MLSMKISEIFGMKSSYPKHACGIEVEMENNTGEWNQDPLIEGFWKVHQEGSLVNGTELVSVPCDLIRGGSGAETKSRLFKELDGFIKANKPRFSERASTHVHLNMRENTLVSVLSIITGYFILENALFYLCHPSRRGNHFCLSLTDSMTMVDRITRSLRSGVLPFDNNSMKYSSLNIGRMKDLGTLEIRMMSSLTSAASIFKWAEDISEFLYRFGEEYKTPLDVLSSYIEDKEGFLRKHLGDSLPIILSSGIYTMGDLILKTDESIPLLMPLAMLDWTSLNSKDFGKKEKPEANRDYGEEPEYTEDNPVPGVMDIDEEAPKKPVEKKTRTKNPYADIDLVRAVIFDDAPFPGEIEMARPWVR